MLFLHGDQLLAAAEFDGPLSETHACGKPAWDTVQGQCAQAEGVSWLKPWNLEIGAGEPQSGESLGLHTTSVCHCSALPIKVSWRGARLPSESKALVRLASCGIGPSEHWGGVKKPSTLFHSRI